MLNLLKGIGSGIYHLSRIYNQQTKKMPHIPKKDEKPCEKCGVIFNHNNIDQVLRHDHDYIKCQICQTVYDRSDQNQLLKHSNEVRCDKCDQIYLKFDGVAKEHHQNEEICSICGLIYDRQKDSNHLIEKHPDQRYCNVCQKICTVAEYSIHQNHIRCHICNQVYDSVLEKAENLHSHLKPIPVDPPGKWSKLIESDQVIDQPKMTNQTDQKQTTDQKLDLDIDLDTPIDQDQLWRSISSLLGQKEVTKIPLHGRGRSRGRGGGRGGGSRGRPPPLPPKTTIINGGIVRTNVPPIPSYNESLEYPIKIILMMAGGGRRPMSTRYIPKNITVDNLKENIRKELELFPEFKVHLIHSGKRLAESTSKIVSEIVEPNKLIYAVITPPPKTEDDDDDDDKLSKIA